MDNRNFALLLDLYELTMAESYLAYKENTFATFDLFVRQLPKNRAYLVASGLEDVLEYIKNLRFSADDLGYLERQRIFSQDFLRFLSKFKFRGDIWAMSEGTVFFAQEPIIRVTASIIEAQVIESYLLNTINLQTMIASKASRVVCAAKDRSVFDFSLRRTHGSHAGIKVARAAYIAGFKGTSNVLAGKLYAIPIVGTMAHSYVTSFKREIESFLAYSKTFPDKTTLLVDTYETKKGIENAIAVGLYLKKRKYRLNAIRLDSGDIAGLSRMARTMLDSSGLNYVQILASGNLDEFKIKDLLERGASVDSFGVGTNMGTSIDAPALDVIYKISEVTDSRGNFLPTMKLSKGKITYPGRKQIFRVKDRRGRFVRDILGLEGEKIIGEPLLKKVVDKGRIVYRRPALGEIRAFLKMGLSHFPRGLKEIHSRYKYPVKVSPQLKNLRRMLACQLRNRQ